MADRLPAYERDPYRRSLTTSVLHAGEDGGRPFAILEDSVLYPGGGGQPCDLGSIDGIAVLEVGSVDDSARHYLASPVAVGPAQLDLDWPRRFDHMQQHTAQHMLSAIALERLGCVTTSFHLGEHRCDIELDIPALDAAAIAMLEEEAATAIRAALPVTTRRIPVSEYRALDLRGRGLPAGHTGDVRLVEIEGIDITTCGGTHLRSTAEIESLQLGPTEPMRGGTRLFWRAGGRVRRRLQELEALVSQMRQLFETSEAELTDSAESRLRSSKETAQELRRRVSELATAHATALASVPGRWVEAHFDGLDGGFLSALGRELVARAPDKVALLTAASSAGEAFLLAAGAQSGIALPEIGPQVAAILDGRGGGSTTIYQGKAGSLQARGDAVALLESLLAE